MRTREGRKSHQRRERIIALDRVDFVFDDDCIRSLVTAHKLPKGIDLSVLGTGVREAARIFVREVRIPNSNELNDEISNLYSLAEKRQFEPLAAAREELSSEALGLLNKRNGCELPSAQDFRHLASRDAACEAVASICRYGGKMVPGRRRPGGRQSRATFQPLLYAPERSLHAPERSLRFKKRDAERNFVRWLRVAYTEATGESPPRTARHIDKRPTTLGEQAKARRQARARHTTLGRFTGFAKDCLTLVGACDVDVVKLIKALNAPRVLQDIAQIIGCPQTEIEHHLGACSLVIDPTKRIVALRQMLSIDRTSENILDAVRRYQRWKKPGR